MSNRIRAALEILARRGWAQGSFTDDVGRHCIQGALYEAHCIDPDVYERVWRPLTPPLLADMGLVNEVIEAEYPERYGAVGVSRFNDHPETTVDDVVRVLEKAAVRRDEIA